MKNQKNKTKISAFALILALTIAATTITVLPIANAAVQYMDSYVYVSVGPNPIGIGQQVLLVFWTSQMPQPETIEEVAEGVRGAWYDSYFIVTKPDGTKQTINVPRSDPVGGGWTGYVPDTIGTYYVEAGILGQWRNTTTFERYYEGATSLEAELIVQQNPLEYLSGAELPANYWERPISPMNREWSQIAGNWMGINRQYDINGWFNPYTTAPKTPHIVWTKPLSFGGIMGGEFGHTSYYTGSAYEPKFTPPIIMNGRLYYNTPDPPRYGFYCVDLRTVETLWHQNSTLPDALVY